MTTRSPLRVVARALAGAAAAWLVAASLAAAPPTSSSKPPAAPKPASTKPATAKPSSTAKPAAKPAPPATPRASTSRSPKLIAGNALAAEELGAYGQAVTLLRQLRHLVPPDADLELALAMDEARSGEADSAAARLASPLLSSALADTLPLARRHAYVWQRDPLWINGTWDGWPWYIARARAEVAAAAGRWRDARDAARLAVAMRPLAGKEWHVLAVCAARNGDDAEAGRAAAEAVSLDPSLPEAHHLAGLLAWAAGKPNTAQAEFRAAVALDSSWRDPALALVRSRLLGVTPDSFPSTLFVGIRQAGLLTSPVRPKLDEFEQMDTPATTISQDMAAIPDSMRVRIGGKPIVISILLDERGRAVMNDLPWLPPTELNRYVASTTAAAVPRWRFTPAVRLHEPRRVWAAIEVPFPK